MEVGIDIVKIPRMEGKEDLAKKTTKTHEYVLYQKRTDKAQFPVSYTHLTLPTILLV